MLYIEAPTEYAGAGPSLFLAGGITGCGNWQRDFADALGGTDLVVLNPRRERFPIDDPTAAEQQIRWEFRHLRRATARLFWFPSATLCPIALFELGAWSRGGEPLFVGVDPAYARRTDVEVQMRLARPDVNVVYSLRDLTKQVSAFSARLKPPLRTPTRSAV
jgi:Nucleoside 2-deoxyribosyltransferase like